MNRLAGRLRLIVVTPGRGELRELDRLCRACIEAAVPALWIRERSLTPVELADLFDRLRSQATASGTLLILGGHSDLPATEAPDGYQLGFRDAPSGKLRDQIGQDPLLGFSAHDPLDPERFSACDYVTLSPIFATSPKRVEHPPIGLERFARLAARVELPVIGLGGIDRRSAAAVIRAGASGVAVMRAVTDARDPGEATRELRSIVEEALG